MHCCDAGVIVVTLRYLSGFECQFLDVSVTNLKGVQDCYVRIVTHFVPPYGGGLSVV